jgi:hypothetical protein
MQTLVMRRGSLSLRGQLDELIRPERERSTRSTAALSTSVLGRKLLANSILGEWILFVVDSLFNCLLNLSKHKLGRSWPQRRTFGIDVTYHSPRCDLRCVAAWSGWGGLIEAIDRSTLHDWISKLTDGNGFGLERFTAGYSVYMPRRHAFIGRFDVAKAGLLDHKSLTGRSIDKDDMQRGRSGSISPS